MVATKRPYQRRRKAPVVALVSVLALLAVATWTSVLFGLGIAAAGSGSCPPSTAAAASGEPLADDALDAVAPAVPGAVRVRVLNAGGQRGQANLVAAQFAELGFAQATPPDNDPLFPDGDMDCVGQVRFGPAGEAAASTVALVLPCAELVRDGRADDTVDVAVGTVFGDLNPVRAARDALDQLADPGADGRANVDPTTGEDLPPSPPPVDPATLQAARDVSC